MRRPTAGTINLNGTALRISSVADAVNAGILLVPEDRQRDGIIPDLSIRENITLGASKGAILDKKADLQQARRLAAELGIIAADLNLPITSLSGGNQQKVLIARCLMRKPALLLLDEPTRGVDVGAKAEIYAILRKLAAQGIGILFTSSEIEETQALAGRVSFCAKAALPPSQFTYLVSALCASIVGLIIASQLEAAHPATGESLRHRGSVPPSRLRPARLQELFTHEFNRHIATDLSPMGS
jgi:erythritol transport system ATP-binding protein